MGRHRCRWRLDGGCNPGANDIRVEVVNGRARARPGCSPNSSSPTGDGKTITLRDRRARGRPPTTPAPTGTTARSTPRLAGRRACSATTACSRGASSKSAGWSCRRRRYLRTAFTADKPVARATLYATGARHLRPVPQRQARQRRVLHPRLDRLHQARLLPRLRRDRRWSSRGDERAGRDRWPTAGTAATSASAASATTTASSRASAAQLAPRVRRRHDATIVATGPDWKAATGPILEADFLMGETYDARPRARRLGPAGLRRQRLGSRSTPAREVQPLVQAHPGPPVRRRRGVQAPRRITEPQARRLRARPGPELRRRRAPEGLAASPARRSRCGSPSG